MNNIPPFALLGDMEKQAAPLMRAIATGARSLGKSFGGAAKGISSGGLKGMRQGWRSGAKGLSRGGSLARLGLLGGGIGLAGDLSIRARGGDAGLAGRQLHHTLMTPFALPLRALNQLTPEDRRQKNFMTDMLGITGPEGSSGLFGLPEHGYGFSAPRKRNSPLGPARHPDWVPPNQRPSSPKDILLGPGTSANGGFPRTRMNQYGKPFDPLAMSINQRMV